MKFQEIINNRVALVMLILSLVISFHISYNIITEQKKISVGTNDCVKGSSGTNSNSLSLYKLYLRRYRKRISQYC